MPSSPLGASIGAYVAAPEGRMALGGPKVKRDYVSPTETATVKLSARDLAEQIPSPAQIDEFLQSENKSAHSALAIYHLSRLSFDQQLWLAEKTLTWEAFWEVASCGTPKAALVAVSRATPARRRRLCVENG